MVYQFSNITPAYVFFPIPGFHPCLQFLSNSLISPRSTVTLQFLRFHIRWGILSHSRISPLSSFFHILWFPRRVRFPSHSCISLLCTVYRFFPTAWFQCHLWICFLFIKSMSEFKNIFVTSTFRSVRNIFRLLLLFMCYMWLCVVCYIYYLYN